MSLGAKQVLIGILGIIFLVSLIYVQAMEVARKREETGLALHNVSIPSNSRQCVECHANQSPGIIDHWKGSTHAAKGVGCVECHQADDKDADSFLHYGHTIATIVTPLDCSRCHQKEFSEFEHSHHAKAGNILASLDNFLAETVEGARQPFNPHSPTPGMNVTEVNGMASVNVGCKQCHGSKVALLTEDGTHITVDDLQPDEKGKPTNTTILAKIKRNDQNQPVLDGQSWPNTGIGRLNLDGSRGSCSACHSRHDFSPRRARQPENCGKCHLGPDHPQKEIYEESKHGVAFRDLKEHMNLDAKDWVLGKDYTQAPTCATCHMSAHSRNGQVTHDPGERISWTNRPPVSLKMDTDKDHVVIKDPDSAEREAKIADSWQTKRDRMKQVCLHCHTNNYVNAFYQQYDDFVVNYNEKFAKPGAKIMAVLKETGLTTPTEFDEEIEWTWFYLWHHEGRRARHGASMMAPDYAHWHGMYEVAERFYQELIPMAREIAEHAIADGNTAGAERVLTEIDAILARPEHAWFESVKKEKEADEQARSSATSSASSPPADSAAADETNDPGSEDQSEPAGTGADAAATSENDDN
ncbi:MAG: multiheme c-type cytochrome [Pirellulaceae bacterium]|nr:hypothetical protein [Planctomycetales bacterium]